MSLDTRVTVKAEPACNLHWTASVYEQLLPTIFKPLKFYAVFYLYCLL